MKRKISDTNGTNTAMQLHECAERAIKICSTSSPDYSADETATDGAVSVETFATHSQSAAVSADRSDIDDATFSSKIDMHLLEPRLQSLLKEWMDSGQVCPINVIRSVTSLSLMRKLVIPENPCEQWQLLVALLNPRRHLRRQRLETVYKLKDVTDALKKAKRILVVTGAGISVSAGIPDFRSPTGLYAQLAKQFPELSHPTDMFSMDYFRKDPRPFYHFAKDIYPGPYLPTVTHKFIHLLESKNKLLRNYSQNIDSLEHKAGVSRVLQCHGGFNTATCLYCKRQVDGTSLKPFVDTQTVPICTFCQPSQLPGESSSSLELCACAIAEIGQNDNTDRPSSEYVAPLNVIKPDITFFGEDLSEEFYSSLQHDLDQTDLFLVIGTSMKVGPVNMIPEDLPENVPQILINREPLERYNFDVELLGDCDTIVQCLCETLGWVSELVPTGDSAKDLNGPLPELGLNLASDSQTLSVETSLDENQVCQQTVNRRESSPTSSDKSVHYINNTVRCTRIRSRVYAFPGAILESEAHSFGNSDNASVLSDSDSTDSSDSTHSGGSDSKVMEKLQRHDEEVIASHNRRRTRSESDAMESVLCSFDANNPSFQSKRPKFQADTDNDRA